jgi:hypothetical protein
MISIQESNDFHKATGNVQGPEFESHQKNLSLISNLLRTGIGPDDFEKIKNIPVSDSWIAKDLIEANLKSGYINLREGKFTTTQITIGVKLTADEFDIVCTKAVEKGMSAEDLILEIVVKGLTSGI